MWWRRKSAVSPISRRRSHVSAAYPVSEESWRPKEQGSSIYSTSGDACCFSREAFPLSVVPSRCCVCDFCSPNACSSGGRRFCSQLCLLDAVRKISICRTRGALSRERNSALSSASQEAVREISVRRMRALQLGGVSALSCAFWMLCTRFLFAECVLLQSGTISSV
jgi:hypothetical protein